MINFEFDNNIIKKEKKIFIINNILDLFINFIRYESKEIKKNYFYQIRSDEKDYKQYYYNPILYIFHVYLYTKQIINYLYKNSSKNKINIKELIDLYKKGEFNIIQLFTLCQRYYELIFILKNYYGFKEFNAILPDFDGIKINQENIFEQFYDIDNFFDIIDKIIKMMIR